MKKQVLFVLAFAWASLVFSQPYTSRIFHFKPQEKAFTEPEKMVIDLHRLSGAYAGLRTESPGKTKTDKEVIRLQQTYKKIPIDHAVAIIHTKAGFVQTVISNWVEMPLQISAQPRFQPDYAKEQILKEFEAGQPVIVDNETLKSGTLIITNVAGDWRLVYEYFVQTEKPFDLLRVLMDAHSGKILVKESQVMECCTPGTAALNYGGTETIYTDLLSGGNYRLRGCIDATGNVGCNSPVSTYRTTRTLSLTDFTNPTTDWTGFALNTAERCALDAHWGTQYVHDYYQHVSSLGHEIFYGANFLNVLLNTLNNNAGYFPGLDRIHYGVVPGTQRYLTALDIVAHELTHGVTFHNSGLGGAGETGAINEAMSDIYASAIENNHGDLDWLMGDDFGTFRNLMNPNAESHPDTYHGFHWEYGSTDNGGIHTNCMVIDYWFYLLVNGGTGTNDIGNAYTVNGIGMTDAMLLMDELQAHYLTPTVDMHEFRELALEAAGNLWYFCSDRYIAVMNAFYAVGIGSKFAVYDPIEVTWETDITGCNATLHWEDVGAQSYLVSYWISGLPSTIEYVSDITTNEVTIRNLLPNTNYIWTVVARCEDFLVPTDHEDSFTTLADCPPLTGLVASDITTCSVLLNWEDNGAWRYEVTYQMTTGGMTYSAFTNDPFFLIHDNLDPNTSYNITVTPTCGDNCLGAPQSIGGTTNGCPELQNLKVDNNPCYFAMTWDVFPNQEYEITMTLIFPNFPPIVNPPIHDFFGTYTFVHSFDPGTQIWIDITTICNGDDCETETTQHFEFEVPEDEPVCEPPTNLSVEYLNGGRIISWDGSPNSNGYYNIEIVFDDHIETDYVYGNVYVTSTPFPDECYTVRVQAICGCTGDLLTSDWAEQYICPPCDPATDLHIEEMCEGWVVLGFTPATNGLEYGVRFWPASNPGNSTTLDNVVWYYPHFTVFPIAPGTTYVVELTTICDQGTTGGPVYFEFTTDPPCQGISNITTTVINSNTVGISWDPTPGANFYELQYHSNSSGTWISVLTLDNHIELTGLELGCGTYTGRLRVICDDCGLTSPFSPEFTFGETECLPGYHIGINPASHCDPCAGPCSICILDGNGNVVSAGYQPDGSYITIAWNPFPGYPVPTFLLQNQSCISISPNYANRPFNATVRKQCVINGQLSPVCQVALGYHFSCTEEGGGHLGVEDGSQEENRVAIGKEKNEMVTIFPNPGNHFLQINNGTSAEVSYQISDTYGRIITKGKTAAKSTENLNTTDWVSGVYYVTVQSENHTMISTTKWVKL